MDSPSPRPRPGSVIVDDSGAIQQVGDWVLGVTLGKGSFGKVKLAVHHRTHEKVAIKIVDKSTISNVDDVERVYRETFILTTLKHPHIIKLYEVLDTPLSIMLVMEYAGGGELYTYVQKQRRLNEVECCRIFTQILNGVEYCHRAKIIHRDLKLENILLTEHANGGGNNTQLQLPNVKIADFGLSNSIKFNEKMGTNCGTPSYTCPEQITGKEYIGSAADIWSLGVIFYAMVCGFLPFEAVSIPLLYKRIRSGLYRCPEYISEEARDLIGRMLTVDADKRATIAELRSHAWMLMEYTELIDKMEGMPEVTEAMVDDAHALCGAWSGEEEKKEDRGRGDKEREREREREKAQERDRERDRDRHEQQKGGDGTPTSHTRILDTTRDRTPSTASNTSQAASKAASEETKEDTQQQPQRATTNDSMGDAPPVRVAGRAGRAGRTERSGGGIVVGGGYGERSGVGKSAGHSIFDKLSIRTNGSKTSISQHTGRRGTEQSSANLLSPRSGGNGSANSAGSAVSPGSAVSSRHRKSISLANIAQPNSASSAEPTARPSAHLSVASSHSEQKASTQPLRFPPISPTANSHQPHSAAPALSSDDTPNPVSPPVGRTVKSRHKLPSSSLLDDHSTAPSAPPKSTAASAATKRSKPLPPPVDAPVVRRPSIDATAAAAGVVGAGGGGGYMADTNASRHRLLNKLNVDLSA